MVDGKNGKMESTKELPIDDVKDILDTTYGIKLKLNDVKDGHHIVMKILEPVTSKEYDSEQEDEEGNKLKNTVYTVKCHYKPKGYDPFDLTIQVGENAVKRLQEKYSDDSYVGKYAFFSRTKYKGGYPQFINPIDNYNEPVDKADLFKKKVTEPVKDKPVTQSNALNLQDFEEFKGKYITMMNAAQLKPNAVHMLGSYIATKEKDRVAELMQLCKDALKKEK